MTHAKPAGRIDVSELEQHRPYLLKFAALQIRRKEVAEDLVQEVFLAAINAADRFAGKSSVRTWLTSILLHKISDHRGKVGRETSIEALQEADGADGVEALFQANGSYVCLPQEWRNPEDSLTDRRFFETLEGCVARLSETAGRAFLLRELMGLSIAEICKEMGLSETNCSVLLHRARMGLRACLEKRWFAREDQP
jgi:RNA polymerase sigma-70 factor, ECF subfamily